MIEIKGTRGGIQQVLFMRLKVITLNSESLIDSVRVELNFKVMFQTHFEIGNSVQLSIGQEAYEFYTTTVLTRRVVESNETTKFRCMVTVFYQKSRLKVRLLISSLELKG